MILTEKQQQAIDEAVASVTKQQKLYKIGGYAGSGKTTIARAIEKQLDKVAVCAFTGKAAYNLRQKGLPEAATIHKIIYDYDRTTRTFNKKADIPFKSFLIDEASMISAEIWRDILSFERPIILIGDTAQLPPVGNDVYLMDDPNIILDTIHRQRAEHGIVAFASNVREGQPSIKEYPNEVTFKRKTALNSKDLLRYDIVICGRNDTRHTLNKSIRYHKGFKEQLCIGDQLIVLQNNPDFDVFNGEIVVVKEIINETKKYYTINIISNGEEKKLVILRSQLAQNLSRESQLKKDIVLCDYGYAITCHKSQGSGFHKVAVIDEVVYGTDPKRWRYTAITRAIDELVYYLNG